MIPIFNLHNPSNEFFTEELCHITELSNSPNDPEQSIARARVAPRITTRWHSLIDTTERYVVISGQGIVEIGDLPPTAMKPLDVVIIPPGTRQRIANIGTGAWRLWECRPGRFAGDGTGSVARVRR